MQRYVNLRKWVLYPAASDKITFTIRLPLVEGISVCHALFYKTTLQVSDIRFQENKQ